MSEHTAENCPQAPVIANINETLKKVVDALEKVAETNIRMNYLEEDNRRRAAENENLFARMREMEMLIGKDGNGFKLEVVEAMDKTKDEITKSMTDLKDSIDANIKPMKESVNKTASFVASLSSKRATYAFGFLFFMIVSGTVCDIVYHKDLFVKSWELLEKIKKGI